MEMCTANTGAATARTSGLPASMASAHIHPRHSRSNVPNASMIPNDTIDSFTLPSLPNLASRDISENAPWVCGDNAPKHPTKTKRRKWQADPTTRHLFYSPFEADNPTLRLSKENHPRLLRAVVVDYDCYSL